MRTRPLVEVAVDSVAAAVMAAGLGADRLELCQDLELGGTTPSLGLIEAVRERVTIPVAVMIRPRGGEFVRRFGLDPHHVLSIYHDPCPAGRWRRACTTTLRQRRV